MTDTGSAWVLEFDYGVYVSQWGVSEYSIGYWQDRGVRQSWFNGLGEKLRHEYRFRNTLTGEIETWETYQTEQPKPHGKGREIAPLVISDLLSRVDKGVRTYGEPLKADNGRDALWDAYEEMLDACMYIRQEIENRRKAKEEAK